MLKNSGGALPVILNGVIVAVFLFCILSVFAPMPDPGEPNVSTTICTQYAWNKGYRDLPVREVMGYCQVQINGEWEYLPNLPDLVGVPDAE